MTITSHNTRSNKEQGCGNNGNQARGRAFMLGAEEACQDPNIVTGTFTLNDHYATTLFDSSADYSFVSTTFIPILGIEPSELGFCYEIEIASGQLVEIDKVIRSCKLQVEGYMFDINLIPFGSGSFNVIIGMDWLSNHMDEIICHEKVAKEQKQEEIVVVRDFPEVYLDDLSGLPPIREIEFRIKLIPGAIPVAKSPYRLTPSEMEELSGQLKELQDKDGIHVDPSKMEVVKNWKAPRTLSEKCKTFDWGEEQERAFQTLKDKLCNVPILALLEGSKDFVVYCDASGLGLGCMLMQRGKVIAYASRQLKINGKNYNTHDLELGAASSIKDKILPAQEEASDEPAEMQRGMDELMERRSDGALDRTSSGHAAIWVIVDRLTKSAQFLPMCEDYKMNRFWRSMQEALGIRLDMSTAYHPQTDGQSERTIKNLEDMLRACVLDFGGSWDVHLPLVEFSYNNSYHSSVRCAPFESLYGRKCHSPIMWAKVGEGHLIGHELVQENTEKISQIKDRLKATRDLQKSYADKGRKALEFNVGDHVLLKVSPWKGVMHFGKKGKLAPRFVGLFEITERISSVAYRLRLPEGLNGVHDTFHVSNLKKCLAGPTLQVPVDEIQVDAKLNFMKEPMEILEREFKKLKRSRISIVKFQYNLKSGPEFTWEREDQMKLKYPHLFSSSSS
ncbi:putative reverse transcriptase domain-containing protein [Tanacetum coccineum]|uniref:Reverse transcriptase domain-containing protein n=1 Tax=Tanacetum coccineum TaxID=301880 RepID=A0ABQ5EW45_9ASTR